MDSTLIASWAAVAATLIAVVVALFKEQLQARFVRPRFKMLVGTRAPYSVKIPSNVYASDIDGKRQHLWGGTIYYTRLWVQNDGNRRGESVEVVVTKLERQHLDGTWVPADGFIPSNLRWSNADPTNPESFHGINPGMGRFCDLGAIADPACITLKVISGVPKGTATFDLAVQTAPWDDGHRLPQGDHKVYLKISAANAEPVEHIVKVSITGNWTEDEKNMFERELGVSILK